MKDIMSIKEVAEYIGMSRSKIYQLIRQKKIPASKIGRQYRFSKEVIDNWIRETIITKKEEPQEPQMNFFKAKKEAEKKEAEKNGK